MVEEEGADESNELVVAHFRSISVIFGVCSALRTLKEEEKGIWERPRARVFR